MKAKLMLTRQVDWVIHKCIHQRVKELVGAVVQVDVICDVRLSCGVHCSDQLRKSGGDAAILALSCAAQQHPG